MPSEGKIQLSDGKSLIEKAKCDRVIIITGIKSLDAVGLKDFC